MSPIQQMLLGVGAVAKKTYVDDIFSTFLYEGTGSSRNITNEIDLSKGGLVWFKDRDRTYNNQWFDTERGVTKALNGNDSVAEYTLTNGLTAFNSNGFSLGSELVVNRSADSFSSWTFRKAKGFFDVVTYTGNGSARTIAHSLGCVPGCIIIKRTDATKDWCVYHRSIGNSEYLELNNNQAETGSTVRFNATDPTASVFSVGDNAQVNSSSGTYVAYLFAGGESTAATARSVELDGSDDYFQTSIGSDYTFGTGDFTIEGWFKLDSTSNSGLLMQASSGTGLGTSYSLVVLTDSVLKFKAGGTEYTTTFTTPVKQWFHIALVRSSSNTSFYVNGILQKKVSDTTDYSGTDLIIGGYWSEGYVMDGSISNFRVVKGTAVYTSSFKPPTEPLTNITNTKLLCFNNSSTTGTTVGTITANGDPTASTDSPFDDPAGFVFGESESESVIRCGSYIGNGSSTGPEINLGWEPQYVLIKNTSTDGTGWRLFDSMRGIVTGGDGKVLYPASNSNEDSVDRLSLTSTGFKLTSTHFATNEDGSSFVYMCVRRPDGYVGKPPELGTGVFAMAAGTSNSDIPTFVSGFPVDFSLYRNPTASDNWSANSRLLGTKRLYTNTNAAESTNSDITWDFPNGFYKDTGDVSDYQAWMWKRHAGFDVVTWTGDGVHGRKIPHSLNNTAQMLWIKRRSGVNAWATGHIGLNGGTNPWNYYVGINETSQETDDDGMFADTAPTSTHFTTGAHSQVNSSGETYIAMLFASVDGISKVGYFDGSSSSQTITTGFQPRFLIVKKTSEAGNWYMVDTVRGWVSGTDKQIKLDLNQTEYDGTMGAPTSTGFTITSNNNWNGSGQKYIYYCHA